MDISLGQCLFCCQLLNTSLDKHTILEQNLYTKNQLCFIVQASGIFRVKLTQPGLVFEGEAGYLPTLLKLYYLYYSCVNFKFSIIELRRSLPKWSTLQCPILSVSTVNIRLGFKWLYQFDFTFKLSTMVLASVGSTSDVHVKKLFFFIAYSQEK